MCAQTLIIHSISEKVNEKIPEKNLRYSSTTVFSKCISDCIFVFLNLLSFSLLKAYSIINRTVRFLIYREFT